MLLLSAYGQSAKEIVDKANQLLRGESSKAELTMRIIRPDWSRELSIKAWNKGDDYSLILITAPPRDKGTAFLKRGSEVWQWIPSIQRVVKIPPSMMSQSWMGSDFTNEDLVREASIVEDYTHELIGDTTVDGEDAYVIRMVPKPGAPVVWEKVIVWITKDDYIERRSEFYAEDVELVNTMLLYDVKKMDGRRIPTKYEMIPADEKGQKTMLIYEDIEFDVPIDDSFFSLQNLKRVR